MISKFRIDLLFVLTGFLLFLIEYFSYSSSLDVALHDTYFVVDRFYVGFMLFIPFSFLGLCYYVFERINKPLKRSLGVIHYLITAITVLFFAIGPLFWGVERQRSSQLTLLGIAVMISTILFLVAQAVFFINILLSIFRKPSSAN